MPWCLIKLITSAFSCIFVQGTVCDRFWRAACTISFRKSSISSLVQLHTTRMTYQLASFVRPTTHWCTRTVAQVSWTSPCWSTWTWTGHTACMERPYFTRLISLATMCLVKQWDLASVASLHSVVDFSTLSTLLQHDLKVNALQRSWILRFEVHFAY